VRMERHADVQIVAKAVQHLIDPKRLVIRPPTVLADQFSLRAPEKSSQGPHNPA